MNRKKVAIIFIYLLNNLGDDLFLQHICLRYPDVDFYVMENNIENKTFSEIDNLYFSKEMKQYFKEFELPQLSKEAKDFYAKFDACVVLGGSIFMQFNQNWRGKLNNFKRRTALNPNTYVMGANFGPFNDPKFLPEHRAAFSKIKDLCFRDSISASFFPDAKNIRYAPDILFSYKYEQKETRNHIAISVINGAWDGRPIKQLTRLKASLASYMQKMVEICSEIARRGVDISLLSFCDRQGDLNVANRIESECLLNGVTNVKVLSYTGDVEPILDELATSKGVIATRFHAMILGFLFGKSVYPIIYDEKQKNVIQDLNFFGDSCILEKFCETDAKEVVDALLSPESKNAFEKIRENVEESIVNAEEQFLALDEFLKREV